MLKRLSIVITLTMLCHLMSWSQTPMFDILVGNEKVSTSCVGVTLTLKNTSVDTTHSFLWNINGYETKSTSTTFSFLKEGTYRITLTDNISNLSYTRSIIINPLPNASFTITQNNVCVGSSIGFTSTSKGQVAIQSYYWSFNDEALISNNATTSYTFNKAGNKKVYLFVKDANGCLSPTSDVTQVAVNGNDNTSFTTSNNLFYTCYNTLNFVNTSQEIGSYNWDFGDGNSFNGTTSPTHTYGKSGQYTVILTSNTNNGSQCASKFSHTVYIGKPQLEITAINDICTNTTFNISATDASGNFNFNIDDYNWQTTDGNFISENTALYYTTAGIHKLSVVNKNGCPSPTSKQITVNPTPNLQLSISPTGNICQIIPVTFTANTDDNVTLKWQLGDGNTITTTDKDTIIHTYQKIGNYDVSVEAINSVGCSAVSQIQTISISSDCTDNGTDSILNPIFKFSSACENKYLVTFEVRNGNKILEKISVDGRIYPFESGKVTIQLPFKGNGATYSVLVRFADGTYDFARDITIMDEHANFSIKNNENASRNCAQNNYTFSSNDYVNSSNISKYIWTIKDTRNDSTIYQISGNSYSFINYYIPYASTFQISLTILDKRDQPCQSDTTQLLTVYGPSGNLKFISDSIFCTSNASVVLKNISNMGSDTFKSMTLDWGDGVINYFEKDNIPDTLMHNYNYIGNANIVNYNINLKISDAVGCTSNLTIENKYRLYNPQISIAPSDSIYCSTKTITILNQSKIIDLQTNGFLWQVGNTIETLSLRQSFSAPISIVDYPTYYNVKITATYGKGITCKKDTTFLNLIKFVKPKAAFTILDSNQLDICPPYILHLKNNASGYKALQWTLSDSIYNTSFKDTILYYIEKTNNDSIKLKIDGYDNCYDSTSLTFISKGPKATLTNENYKSCVPLATNLRLYSSDPIENYLWNFGDSTAFSSPNATTVSHEYSKGGKYIPSVTIIGTVESGHCFNNLELATPIQVDEKINLQFQNLYSYCLGDSVNGGLQLSTASNATDDFTWSTNTSSLNTIITDKTKNHITVKPTSPTTYTVLAKSRNTCLDETGTITVDTHESPIVTFNEHNLILPAGSLFNPSPTIHSSFSDLKYLWTPTSGIDNRYISNPQMIADKDITYKLQVTNTFGCTATDSLHVKTLCSSSKILIPSAFTPNSDGKNDIFYVKGYGIKIVNHFIVVDRWGKVVFERNNINANDISNGWNGYVDRLQAPAGTYVYFADMTCTEGNKFHLKGTVVLIK